MNTNPYLPCCLDAKSWACCISRTNIDARFLSFTVYTNRECEYLVIVINYQLTTILIPIRIKILQNGHWTQNTQTIEYIW